MKKPNKDKTTYKSGNPSNAEYAGAVTAKCPRCEKLYKTYISHNGIKVPWTGNGTPRIVCPECRHYYRTLSNRTWTIQGA